MRENRQKTAFIPFERNVWIVECNRQSLKVRCRANMAHIRQSRPDSGLGFQVDVLEPFHVVPSSLGSGETNVFITDLDRFLMDLGPSQC